VPRSRSVAREIPGVDWRLWPGELAQPDWTEIFAAPSDPPLRIHVDIGFGRGEFLTELARREPDAGFIGIERDFERVLKFARQLSRMPIRNIRLIGSAAEWAVREAFADASVTSFWINFPDPWPKRDHRRRRLIAPRFVAELARKLAPGGGLYVATDDADYAAAIDAVLSRVRGLYNAHSPDRFRNRRSAPHTTRFEQQWTQGGRQCFYFQYRSRAPSVATVLTADRPPRSVPGLPELPRKRA